MPVGTRGAVKHLTAADLDRLGVDVMLANTYHLMLRPGPSRVAAQGGLEGFTGWAGHHLTDSGGYQVFSLTPSVDDDGVTFRSTYDGDEIRLTPERAVGIQEQLGGDIQMALDVCPPLPSPPGVVATAVERTAAWARRAIAVHRSPRQGLFGIVQGGVDVGLRRQSSRRTAELPFDGFGIGGFSVGEEAAPRADALAATLDELPADRPRYLMGVGDPVGLITAIELGVDMFDCVLPTRHARHGTVLTGEGRLNLRNAGNLGDDRPLDDHCPCEVCQRHSRAFLAHLLRVKEPTGARLVTIHNVAWTLALVDRARRAIETGRFEEVRRSVIEIWT
jgi:queuine tRNA-ribosyltransferase